MFCYRLNKKTHPYQIIDECQKGFDYIEYCLSGSLFQYDGIPTSGSMLLHNGDNWETEQIDQSLSDLYYTKDQIDLLAKRMVKISLMPPFYNGELGNEEVEIGFYNSLSPSWNNYESYLSSSTQLKSCSTYLSYRIPYEFTEFKENNAVEIDFSTETSDGFDAKIDFTIYKNGTSSPIKSITNQYSEQNGVIKTIRIDIDDNIFNSGDMITILVKPYTRNNKYVRIYEVKFVYYESIIGINNSSGHERLHNINSVSDHSGVDSFISGNLVVFNDHGLFEDSGTNLSGILPNIMTSIQTNESADGSRTEFTIPYSYTPVKTNVMCSGQILTRNKHWFPTNPELGVITIDSAPEPFQDITVDILG